MNTQRVRIVRALANNDQLDALQAALSDVESERADIQRRLDTLNLGAASEIDPVKAVPILKELARRAAHRLHSADRATQAAIFDLLDLQLYRTDETAFEGTAALPLVDDPALLDEILPTDAGDVRTKVPQRLDSNLTAIRFRIEVAA